MTRRLHRAGAAGVLVVALVLGALGTASFARRIGATRPAVGVEWTQTSLGPLAVSVTDGSPAWVAGLRPGDLLLRFDGQAVTSALDAASRPWNVAPGERVTVEVERGPERLTVQLEPASERRTEPYGYLALVGLAFLVSGSFIALRWPNVRGGRLYGALAASLFVLLVFSHTGRGDALDWAVYWMDLAAAALAPALLLHFALASSRRAVPAGRLAVALAYAPAVALLVGAVWLSPAALGGAYAFRDPLLIEEGRERLEALYLGLAAAVSAVILARSFGRSSSALHRSQMRWLLWGLVAGLTPFVAFYAVPFSLGASNLPPWVAFLSVLPMLIVPATFTAALARYRLFDLSSLVRRGLSEVTAVFVTFAIYAAVREAAAGVPWFSASGSRYAGILLAAVAFAPLRKWVRGGVDRAFYRERYSYRATLLDWARDLSAETDLDSLLERLSGRIRETIGLREALVLLRTGDATFEGVDPDSGRLTLRVQPDWVEQLDGNPAVSVPAGSFRELPWARWLFAMKVKGRLTAVLAIADRQATEEPLSTEDRALLSTLSAHAATAIEAARLVREVRRRAEEIEDLHARQERILESSAVGLLLTDEEGRILAWNRALEAIYALPRDQAIGRRLSEVFPLHMVRRVEREAASTPPGEQARLDRFTLINHAGQRSVVNLTINPATASTGVTGNRVITFDDVSERVKLEEQVLRQERLAALGMLAAGVAHEVNTPLTGISSYTQMLLEELDPGDPRRETLEKIEGQSLRASDIVNSLLNLARPERGGFFEELSLNDTIREVLQLFEPQVRGSDVRVRTRLAEDLPRIRGNRGKLQQVLLNLLINARDAIDGHGRIEITTRHRGDAVVCEVVDSGIGIAEEDLPRVFDPFFTTKRRGQGTGLGLSISYGIVIEHGGEMHVESTPGEFTRFRVELPVAAQAQALA